MARGPAVKIILGDSEHSELEMRARRRKIARVDAMRAEIVLLAADGMNNCAIAATLGVSRLTVGLWRKRFAKKRFDGLDDEPRCGAPRKIDDEKITEVVTKTLETMPADATHWSTRSMARTSGVSISTVHRIWNAFSLAPHRSETFKLSTVAAWSDRAAHPRLRTPRHDDAVRRARCESGNDRRQMHAAPPRPGVPQVPRRNRAQRAH
jgi:transposase